MSLKEDAWPSSAAFDLLSSALQSETERADVLKKGSGTIFVFTLKNDASETHSWHIDASKTGTVAKGPAPEGVDGKVVTLLLSDVDFAKLVSGKANAQKLFMSGKLKVKGDVMRATKLEPILKKAQDKAKL